MIIPPLQDYKWKMCPSGREYTRKRAQRRKHDPNAIQMTDDEHDDLPLIQWLERKKQMMKFKRMKLLFKGVTVADVQPRPKEVKAASETSPFKLVCMHMQYSWVHQ